MDEGTRPSLASLNFDDDLKATLESADGSRWKFERRTGLEVGVTVFPADHPADTFVARLMWLDYPGAIPPSVKFVDPETGRLDVPTAWPKANGFRPPSLDICSNWTAEGFALHPEWARTQYRWQSSGNIILKVVRILQTELDTSYTGRFHG
jgi:hypothetical protein